MLISLKFFQKLFHFWFLLFSTSPLRQNSVSPRLLPLLSDPKASLGTQESVDVFFFCNFSSSDEKKKNLNPSSSRAKDRLQERFEEDTLSPELIDWLDEFDRKKDEQIKEEVLKPFEESAPLQRRPKSESLIDIESDSEDCGWRDPFEEDYDDADYESFSEEEWPEDERPLQSPKLNNPPRIAPSEKKKLFHKSNDGRDYLPWEDRRDFWALLRRRNGLTKRQWEQMQAHIEKYAPEWDKWDEESGNKKDGDKS